MNVETRVPWSKPLWFSNKFIKSYRLCTLDWCGVQCCTSLGGRPEAAHQNSTPVSCRLSPTSPTFKTTFLPCTNPFLKFVKVDCRRMLFLHNFQNRVWSCIGCAHLFWCLNFLLSIFKLQTFNNKCQIFPRNDLTKYFDGIILRPNDHKHKICKRKLQAWKTRESTDKIFEN